MGERGGRNVVALAVSHAVLIQNNQYAKVTYLGAGHIFSSLYLSVLLGFKFYLSYF